MKATAREKAIIFAMIAGYIDTWKEAYIISRDKPAAETSPEKLDPSIVTRWKQRTDIQKAIQDAERILKDRDQANQDKGRRQAEDEQKQMEGGKDAGDSNRTKPAKPGRIDYYDPQNQRRTINAIIDRSQDDPKTQLDAIKAIQQTQRDDRQAAKDNQIQRFYTPVTCKICPLYQKRTKKG